MIINYIKFFTNKNALILIYITYSVLNIILLKEYITLIKLSNYILDRFNYINI